MQKHEHRWRRITYTPPAVYYERSYPMSHQDSQNVVNTNTAIAARVRQAMGSLTVAQLAQVAYMPVERLESALAAQTGFSSLDTALIADALSLDAIWLITGEPDPHAMVIHRCVCDDDDD